jgi:hypothetical protein
METPGRKLICRGSHAGCDELRDGDMQATSLRMASAWQARLPLQSRAIEFYRDNGLCVVTGNRLRLW